LPFGGDDYELYIVKRWEANPLCHALPENSPFYSSLSQLYTAAMESCNHPKLDASIMFVIDEFMKDPVNLEEEQLPF